ncbi:hypothetical protein ACFV4M_36840 [Kitasatospora indigofera]|uniref:hypothetical protein n=1 Tax=Kitasatospora indigofera TaxID=67307 RepID=UPI003656AC53
MTTNRPHSHPQPPLTTAELHLAWQRAKALWSSDPTDPDAYTAFIQAGTTLYRSSPSATPAQDATLPVGTPRDPRTPVLPAYLRLNPLHQRPRPWHAPTP